MQPTILIVDDQPLVLGVLRDILSRGPYRVIGARSAEEGLDLMINESIDVVISDERMPGMKGSEFLAVARQSYPDTVRIILTGHASVQGAIRAINEGEIFRFLTKPANSLNLHKAVKDALAHKRSREQLEHKSTLLKTLEKQAPGITQVQRDEDGVILIDEDD